MGSISVNTGIASDVQREYLRRYPGSIFEPNPKIEQLLKIAT
jgi:hypothetical protein